MKTVIYIIFALILTTEIHAQDIIIKDVNIIAMTSNKVMMKQSLLIKNGKIEAIGDYKNLAKSKNTKIIVGTGNFLMPGLADMHVHLPEEEKIQQLLLSNVAAGVTQIRVMNSVAPQLAVRNKLSSNNQLISPNIHFSHLVKSDETFTAAQADSLMKQLIKDKINFVKLLSLSDEQTFDNLSNAANKNGIILCGHYPVYRKDGKTVRIPMEKVLKSNYKSIEHLAGYIWQQDDQKLDEAIAMTKKYGIYNCPTIDWDIMAYNMQYPEDYKNRLTYQFLPDKFKQKWDVEYAVAITKAGGNEKVIATKDKYKASFDLKLKVLKKLYDNDCLLLVGSDPGNVLQADGFNVYEEMVNWSKAGIDNYTILKSATVNPSKFFNESNKWGTIEIGKNADLIMLQKNPLENINNIKSVETTIIGQKIYQNKALINQL